MTKRYNITPVPKPRQTRADKWKQRPVVLRYRAYADIVRAHKINIPEAGVIIRFVLPMPKSWSDKKKKEMNMLPHQQKPDIDNLLKALLDAVHKDDSHIWQISGLSKVWGRKGQIIIGDK